MRCCQPRHLSSQCHPIAQKVCSTPQEARTPADTHTGARSLVVYMHRLRKGSFLSDESTVFFRETAPSAIWRCRGEIYREDREADTASACVTSRWYAASFGEGRTKEGSVAVQMSLLYNKDRRPKMAVCQPHMSRASAFCRAHAPTFFKTSRIVQHFVPSKKSLCGHSDLPPSLA